MSRVYAGAQSARGHFPVCASFVNLTALPNFRLARDRLKNGRAPLLADRVLSRRWASQRPPDALRECG